MNGFMVFVKKHSDFVVTFCLFVICYIFLFYHLGNYPLIDVDETRYASMAREVLTEKDWITMHLNCAIFYEKPPLYFWLVALSYLGFGKVSEFSTRFPIALIGTFVIFYTYYFGKKTISRAFGLISAIILVSSLEFLLLARIAIIDMIFTAFITASIYSGFLTFFCTEKNKKYFWWSAYFFSALAVLSKGLPGFAVPFAILGLSCLVTGRLREIFRPQYILPGVLIFFITALPWHIIMYQIHGMEFINEYFMKHHFSRFADSKGLGRKEPIYFFIPVFVIGFFPWILSFIAYIINNIQSLYIRLKESKNHINNIKKFFLMSGNNVDQLLILISCYFLVVFIFFSLSSTKLPTYILPAFPAASLLTGYYWYQFIFHKKNYRGIIITTWILNIICILAGIAAIFITPILNHKVQLLIAPMKAITIIWFIIMPIITLLLLNFNRRILLFASQAVFMAGILLISVYYVFTMVCNAGEKDLVEYARYAKRYNNAQLITFNYGIRPSILFYYGSRVYFIQRKDYKTLKEYLSKDKPVFIVIRTSYLEDFSKNIKLNLVKKGLKYTLISNKKP